MSSRSARRWNSRSPGVDGAVCTGPWIGANGRRSAGRRPGDSRSHSADPMPTTHDSRPPRSRKPTFLTRSPTAPSTSRMPAERRVALAGRDHEEHRRARQRRLDALRLDRDALPGSVLHRDDVRTAATMFARPRSVGAPGGRRRRTGQVAAPGLGSARGPSARGRRAAPGGAGVHRRQLRLAADRRGDRDDGVRDVRAGRDRSAAVPRRRRDPDGGRAPAAARPPPDSASRSSPAPRPRSRSPASRWRSARAGASRRRSSSRAGWRRSRRVSTG